MLIRLLASKQNKVIAANILSFLHIIMVPLLWWPFFVFFLNFKEKNSQFAIISLIIFIVASITDFFRWTNSKAQKNHNKPRKVFRPFSGQDFDNWCFFMLFKI